LKIIQNSLSLFYSLKPSKKVNKLLAKNKKKNLIFLKLIEFKQEYLLNWSLFYRYLNNKQALETWINDLNIKSISFLLITNGINH
jgi:hypothetical protein